MSVLNRNAKTLRIEEEKTGFQNNYSLASFKNINSLRKKIYRMQDFKIIIILSSNQEKYCQPR